MRLLSDYLHDCLMETMFSPDIHEIQHTFTHVPVFVYGTEKFKFSDFQVMDNMPRLGIGCTTASRYEMYMAPFLGPIVMTSIAPAAGKIFGEVFLVTPQVLFWLDDFHQNDAYNRRKEEYIRYYPANQQSEKEKDWYISKCWMYQAVPHMWKSKLEDKRYTLLDLTRPDNNPQRQYYVFKRTDDPNYTQRKDAR